MSRRTGIVVSLVAALAASAGSARAAETIRVAFGTQDPPINTAREPVEAILAQLDDPAISYGTTPQRVGGFAELLAKTGTIPARPASWKELLFPTVHELPGS
jgi:hypothetical protein